MRRIKIIAVDESNTVLDSVVLRAQPHHNRIGIHFLGVSAPIADNELVIGLPRPVEDVDTGTNLELNAKDINL